MNLLSVENLSRRSVTEEDSAFLRHLYAAERAGEIALFPWTDTQKEAFLAQQLAARQAHYAAAFPDAAHSLLILGSVPIGALSVVRSPVELHLLHISLLPEWRNHGLGTALLQEMVSEAEAAPLLLRLQVAVYNPASRLYARLGFQSIVSDGIYTLMEYRPAALPRSSLTYL